MCKLYVWRNGPVIGCYDFIQGCRSSLWLPLLASLWMPMGALLGYIVFNQVQVRVLWNHNQMPGCLGRARYLMYRPCQVPLQHGTSPLNSITPINYWLMDSSGITSCSSSLMLFALLLWLDAVFLQTKPQDFMKKLPKDFKSKGMMNSLPLLTLLCLQGLKTKISKRTALVMAFSEWHKADEPLSRATAR